ncbi:MAG: peptidase M28 [Bacteroidetes bacterium]|nr:MAG: peptidase M28 [Bacteroidota bacterium]
MRIFLILFLFFPIISVLAQSSDPTFYEGAFSDAVLKKHLYTLASPEMEGRKTATPGQQKAAAYIENHFRSLDLRPGTGEGYQMFYPVYRDSMIKMNIEVNGKSYQPFTDFEVNVPGNFSTTMLGREWIYAGYGFSDSLRDDYIGLDVRGKIVMVLGGEPPELLQQQLKAGLFNPFAKREAAQAHGAAALIVIQKDFPRMAPSNPGPLYKNAFKDRIRIFTIDISEKMAGEMLNDPAGNFSDGHAQPKPLSADILLDFKKEILTLQSSNVLGYIEGSDLKDQWLVISAHYDHLGKRDSIIYFGADDDGSGTTALLTLASAFAKAKADGHGPRRSILFLANSGEEEGLWGSQYFVSHSTMPLKNVTADLNIDMIGRIDSQKKPDSVNYVYIVGDNKISSELHPINEAANNKFVHLNLDYLFNDPKDPERIYYRSDHYNFAKEGVPIIFYFDGIHKDYHKPTDTPDRINYDILSKRAQLVFYTAWELANRPKLLKRDLHDHDNTKGK